MADLATTFAQPGSTYRGKPFWAWNGKLEEEELRRQIRVFHRMGLGGAFMHSRVGLDTPYLSDEWMRLVKACIDECETLEMEAWLYDEDRWPSGAAGGLVTRDERYRARELHCRELTPARYRPGKGRLAVFAAQKKGDALTAYRPLKGSGRPKKGEVALVFDVRTQPTSDWYNGASYLDTMNHAAVQRFLTITHQAYADEAPIRKAFGKVVPGIFTDEPNRGGALAQSTFDGAPSVFAPWTDRLPQIFRKRYGYDLLDRLPEVFYDMAGVPVREARYHYHDCTTFLFVDAFARQIGEWCERHRLLHTGHVLAEPTPRSQTRVVGSAMRFYEHMQAPGIDILTEHGRELDTAKQCASVLRQTGRTWMLSELYGCTGWQFPFEGHKAVGDWQAALGVNLRCQHLSWYTMEGQAKRDYPASIFFQSPWWEAYGAVEDYFARLGVLLTQGEAVRDLLVVHPLESTWVRYAQGEDAGKDLDALDQALVRLRNMLLEAHIDYDYGDEEMLDRLGKVRRGKGETPPRLAVGKADYRMVLVPPLRTIRGSTVRLLERFARSGGTVVFVGEGPDHVDAVPGADARDLQEADGVETCVFDPRSLLKAVEPARRVSVLDRRGREVKPVLYQLRTTKEGQILFLCNTDRGKGAGPVRVRLDGRDAEEWDAATGERYRASTARDGDALVIETDLPPGGSRLFVVRDRAVRGLQPRPEAGKGRRRTLDRKRWTIQRSEPNVFVLDRPAWKLDSGAWRKPDEILKIDQACRDHLGLPRRGGRMAQPWTR
ncbi:MAG: glycosyl hydrolase, partial [Planctomycetota bacterium]